MADLGARWGLQTVSFAVPVLGETAPIGGNIVIAQIGPRPPIMPPGGGANRPLPPGIINRPPPGFYYYPPGKMDIPVPEWGEAVRLRDKLQKANGLDARTRQELELPWPWLEMKRGELEREARNLDRAWERIRPGIEIAINAYITEYWRIVEENKNLQADILTYQTYCSRTVPPEDLGWAQRECLDKFNALKKRESDLIGADEANTANFAANVVAAMDAVSVDITAYRKRFEHWQDKVLDFIARSSEALKKDGDDDAPLPLGWSPDWERIPSTDGKVRWRDPDGNVWTWHSDPSDRHGRGGDHWDVGTPDGRQFWVDPQTGVWHPK